MGPIADERRQLEQLLLERLRDSERAYRQASAAVRDLVGYAAEIGRGNPDGAYALHQAAAAERLALGRYSRALKIFSDLVVSGKRPSRRDVLEPLLNTAIESSLAHMGNIQVLDPCEGALKIEVQSGFDRPFLDFFARVHHHGSACGEAWRTARRVIVEDVMLSPVFAGTESLRVMLSAGVRAVQSTPVFSPSGVLVGMLSTHYRAPSRPSAGQLSAIDCLVEQAGILIAGSTPSGDAQGAFR